MAFGKLNKTDKIKIGKGQVVFFEWSSQKILPVPCWFLNEHESKTPLCWGGRGQVFLFLFSRKKKKGLKGFMVLVGTADSLAEHTLYEYKV